MKLTFEKAYRNGDDLILSTERLDYDLRQLGYDDEHRTIIINAVFEKAARDKATFAEDEYASIWQ